LKSHGRQAEFVLDHGSSDGRFFAEHGIPVIISQPDGANLHAPGEWVDTQAIVLYYKVLKSYVDTVA
jgi:succinyl-diaminopimelate desuccinylase